MYAKTLFLAFVTVCYIALFLLMFKLLFLPKYMVPQIATFEDKKLENVGPIPIVGYTEETKTLKEDNNDYLLPINFILAKRYSNGTEKEVIQKALKEGQGLNPYVSGGRGWIENGIVYRPFREQKHIHMSKRKSPYKGDFEEYVPFDKERFFRGRDPDTIPSDVSQKKIILWYTKTRYHPPMPRLTPLRVCPDFPCVMTHDRGVIQNASAVLFSAQLLGPNPPSKRQNQVFIFHNHEVPNSVPRNYFSKSKWRGIFNWTMAFQMDSDIPGFYGAVRKRPIPLQKDYKLILSNKTKHVAWLVSNCNAKSNRDLYVKELNKYIPVDVHGACGKFKCGRDKDDQCKDLFSRQYKFYLAFESSICLDYITEKLFIYLQLDLIVVGRASNEYYKHLPSDMFINADDYPSPKALAERLNFLDKNDEEYINMLRIKDQYMSILQDYPILNPNGHIKYMSYRKEEVSFCLICYRIWNIDRYSKTIPDILKWFERGKCQGRVPI